MAAGMSKSTGEWMSNRTDGCVGGGWVRGWVDEWIGGWMSEQVDGWMHGWVGGWVSG